MRSARSETGLDGYSVQKGLASTPKIICISLTDSGAWCRSSIERVACFITLAKGERGTESFNCRPGCRLISRIASTSWIRLTGVFRSFTTTAWPERVTGGNSEQDPVAGLHDDRDDDLGACFRRGTGSTHSRRVGHA